MRSSLSRLATTIVVVLLVAGCASATSPAPTTTSTPSVPAADSPASAKSPDNPTPTTAPLLPRSPSEPAPAALRWLPIGTIPARGATGLVSFDGGYVAYGDTDEQMRPVAWFSADGRDWVAVELGGTVPCGSELWPAASVRHGATNGLEVVLVGSEWPDGSRPCDGSNSRDTRPVAWITSDGQSWQRSDPIQPSPGSWPAAHNVWAIPGGWEAAIGDASGPNVVWQSAGGRIWYQVAEVDGGEATRLVAAAANPDGTRLILVNGRDTGRDGGYLLLTSENGRTWHEVAHPVGDGWGQYWILPSAPRTQNPWVVISGDASASVVSTSFDLEAWERQPVPMPAVAAFARTRYGLLAIGFAPEPVDVASDYTTYLSADAHTWTELESSVPVYSITDGRAGVLGIAWDGSAEGVTVWRLTDTPAAAAPVHTALARALA